jgi:SAM-dependent methyltransferase
MSNNSVKNAPRNAPTLPDTVNSCSACQSENWTDFFVSNRVIPVDVGSSPATEAEARTAPLAEITLAYCHNCGLVWNRFYDSSQIAFRPGYDASLHHSPLVNSFVDALVTRLINRFDLHGKDIVEVGCGSGYFLHQLCERGGNRGIGVDPTVPRVGTEKAGSGQVQFIRDFYSKRYQDLPCDFLCCQSVLEVITNPSEFLTDVGEIVRRRGATTYFEMFNAGRAFDEQETWSIHYEQCNYFSLDAFRSLFQRCGFQILDAGVCTGNDQYIFIEAKPLNHGEHQPLFSNGQTDKSAAWPRENEELNRLELPPTLSNFDAHHHRKLENWREKLAACREAARKVVTWGTGGKGVSFLNSVGPESGIRYVVDSNPTRHGRFVPGSAQQIVSPAFLADYRPDVVILSNRAYDAEIRQQIATVGLHPEIWHA